MNARKRGFGALLAARTENERFLEALFKDAAAGTHTIVCAYRGDPYTVTEEARRAGRPGPWAGRPWAPGERLPRWFSESRNTYLTISTFDPDPETGERRRRKANFRSMHAVMVDDVGTKVPHDKLLLPPSALIETSPKNFQAFYFLIQDTATRDRELCERLIDRMVAAGLTADGADPGMRGVTRYGRLPVGVNGKAKYVKKLGQPFAVRSVLLKPKRRYRLDDIATAWGLDLTPPPPRRTVLTLSPKLAKRAATQFSALIETLQSLDMYVGQRGPIHDVVCPWVSEHTDGATSGTALFEPSADNAWIGGFRCHHGHCEHRGMREVQAWLRKLVRLLDEREAV